MAPASKLLSLPPNTGQSLMAAFNMPGSVRSMPYIWAPVVLSTVSSRASRLPASFQSFGFFRLTAVGCANLPAAVATLPKVVVRPLGTWVMMLLAARQSAADTCHSSAAACTSIMRAMAPPLRT